MGSTLAFTVALWLKLCNLNLGAVLANEVIDMGTQSVDSGRYKTRHKFIRINNPTNADNKDFTAEEKNCLHFTLITITFWKTEDIN